MARYTQTNDAAVNNDDYYVAVYLTEEGARAEDRDQLLTVQSFHNGDFPLMKSLDTVKWDDGELVSAEGKTVPFVVRVCRRKPEKPAPTGLAWKSSPASESKPT